MKKIVPLAAIAALLAISCSNMQDSDSSLKSRGVITGPDFRRCANPCCGGWFIEIDGTRYRFLELPKGSDIRLSEANFPIPVRLSWSKIPETEFCMEDVITVHAISRE